MDDPVDSCGGGHRVFEDLFPLAEDEIAGDDDGLSFVPLSQKSKKHLYLFLALPGVADIVKDERIEVVEFS